MLRPFKRVLVRCLPVLLFALFLPVIPALAAKIPWQHGNFQYSAEHKDLKDVIRDFAASERVMTWISPEVSGSVSGKFAAPPQEFLDTLAGSFGFLWYYDGTVLWIWGANEVKTVTLDLGYADVESVRSTLERMKVLDSRFPINYDDDAHTVVLSGPPGYVDRIASIAKSIDHRQGREDHRQVRVFTLDYARAADRTTEVDGHRVLVPGLATLLRQLFSQRFGQQAGGDVAGSSNSRRLPSLQSNESSDISSINPIGGSQANQSPVGLPNSWFGGGRNQTNQSQVRPPLPQTGEFANLDSAETPLPQDGGLNGSNRGGAGLSIEADPRTNSIIVRDAPEHMDDYAALIHKLDRRPALLEIDATIIEVQDGAMRDLGLDWRQHNGHLDTQVGSNNQSARLNFPNATQSLGDSSSQVQAQGGVLTAVLGDAGRYLMTRISALEQENKANIVSSPKVTTLDNVEAVMDQRDRFFVRVAGYQSADLYSLSAGVSLRVLPTVVPRKRHKDQIRLEVTIEDGQLSSQSVDQIPVIHSSQITTQAFIREGQSLLVAGYENSQDGRQTSGVPGLSKIPLLGKLFQRHVKQRSRVQRLFLLTPHLVVSQ